MKKPHYAWLVCLGGMLSVFVVVGLGINSFGIYQPYIISLNGFTNTQGSWITTVRSFSILVGLITVNPLCSRIGLRAAMTFGTVLVGCSCICFSLAETFYMYSFGALLAGFGCSFGGMLPLSIVIGHWFSARKSLAVGIAAAGSGVATFVAPPLITWMIEEAGLSIAFFWEGFLILGLSCVVWCLIRNAPHELGVEPYTAGQGRKKETPAKQAKRAKSKKQMMVFLLAVFLLGGPGSPGISHLSVLFTAEGYDAGIVAAAISCFGVMLTMAKPLSGLVYDRIGGYKGNAYMFAVGLVSFLLCCTAPIQNKVLLFLTVVAFGLGVPLANVSLTQWANDLYPEEQLESGLRHINIIFNAGGFVLGPVPGMLADCFGSYVPAYMLFFFFLLFACVTIQMIYRL